jgi:hypothetical protein
MHDPHVVSLEYVLETDDTLAFNNPLPLEGDAVCFTYRLADGVAHGDHEGTTTRAKRRPWWQSSSPAG